jgi:hypothetical protein
MYFYLYSSAITVVRGCAIGLQHTIYSSIYLASHYQYVLVFYISTYRVQLSAAALLAHSFYQQSSHILFLNRINPTVLFVDAGLAQGRLEPLVLLCLASIICRSNWNIDILGGAALSPFAFGSLFPSIKTAFEVFDFDSSIESMCLSSSNMGRDMEQRENMP